jgi:hypothetical protein
MAQDALIKITIDPSKGIATINGVKVALKDLANAQKEVNDQIEKNNEAIEGSLKWHKMMVSKLNAEREALSTNAEQFDELTIEIKKHNEAINEITKNKELERAAIKGSFQDYENQIIALRRQQKTMADNNEAVLEYERRIKSLRAEQRQLTTGTRLTGKGMASMSSSAGLAGAAATEFGRMVGDAQYGIQGMSNNIQQLGSLFTDLVQQEGSTRKAFDLFKATLVGPAGVLVAISLVTTAIEFFVRSQKDAEDAVKDFNESVFLETGALTILAKKYKDQNTQDENRIQILYQLALANENVRNIIQDETLTIDQRIKKGEQFIDNQIALNEARKELAEITATLEGVEADAIPTIEEYNKAKEIQAQAIKTVSGFGTQLAKTYDDSKQAELDAADRTVAVYEAQEKQAEVSSRVIGLQDIINDLTDDGNNKKEKERAIIANSIRDYEKRIKKIKEEMENVDLNSEAYQKLEKQLTSLDATYQNLLITQRMLDVESAEAAMEAADARIQAAMKSIGFEQTNFAKRKELRMREQGNGDDFLGWSIGFYERLKDDQSFSEEERLRFYELYVAAKEKLEKQEEENADKTADKIKKATEAKFKATMKAWQNISETIGVINDFMESEAQREIDIETNKTNAINDQLRQRLLNEEISKDERNRINQEIARNEAALVEKENAINEKRFKQQKAFNISMAIIDTYVAANQALKDETIPNTFARIAAMISIIGTGLANVATISRQQFVASVPSTRGIRGTSGTEGGDRVFNVVGASAQTQIAEAIAAIEEKPIKAYVVSSDVTSAQEMDRKVIEGASI